MLRPFAATLLIAFVASPLAARTPLPPERLVAELLDDFHDAAAKADENRYFSHFAPEGVFLGTAPEERWTVKEFRAFAHPYFEKGKGWTFVPAGRNVTLLPGGTAALFDEALSSESYGRCRGTGVARRDETGGWKIAQYSLSIPLPNDLTEEIVGRIRKGTKKTN